MRSIRIEPDLRHRVWGGTRLTPPGGPVIGEAWLAGPWSEIGAGSDAAATLASLAAAQGARLTGRDAPDPERFPLLAKILDPAEWLSVQVHPDDALALQLEGPGAVGKTEAWYVIEAAPARRSCWGSSPRCRRGTSGRPSATGAWPTCCSGTRYRRARRTWCRPGPCMPSAPGCWRTRSSSPRTSRIAAMTGVGRPAPDGPCTSSSRSSACVPNPGRSRCARARGRMPAGCSCDATTSSSNTSGRDRQDPWPVTRAERRCTC